MTNVELFKQKLEAYKIAETLSEQNKLIKELQNICLQSTLPEKKRNIQNH